MRRDAVPEAVNTTDGTNDLLTAMRAAWAELERDRQLVDYAPVARTMELAIGPLWPHTWPDSVRDALIITARDAVACGVIAAPCVIADDGATEMIRLTITWLSAQPCHAHVGAPVGPRRNEAAEFAEAYATDDGNEAGALRTLAVLGAPAVPGGGAQPRGRLV
jgi:hypothetical protein